MLTYPANMWLINRPHAAYGYGTKMSTRKDGVLLAESQYHVIDSTNFGRALDNRVQYRLHVCGRAVDDPQYLRRRRMMFQGLANFLRLLRDCLLLRGDYLFQCSDRLTGRRDTPLHGRFLRGLFSHRAKKKPRLGIAQSRPI